jgi:hypothetical protein
MSVRITSLIMILALTATVVAGVPLHPSERGCTMPDVVMKDCGQMANEPISPGITQSGLCCLINCQEPGPTSTAVKVRAPSVSGAFLAQILPMALPGPAPPTKWIQAFSFTSTKTYLKNLALLI